MSLSSTSTIKQQISSQLGAKAPAYFEPLASFVTGKISRPEFEDSLKAILDAPNLIQLHNALIKSLFDVRSFKRPLTPPPNLPTPPSWKRRSLLYQGPGDDGSIQSERLKQWTVSVGKHERNRIAALESVPPPTGPRLDTDEIACERGIVLLPERGEPLGSRLTFQLATITRSPNVQHIADRINHICILGPPSCSVSSLMHLACEVVLITLLLSSHIYSTSIEGRQYIRSFHSQGYAYNVLRDSRSPWWPPSNVLLLILASHRLVIASPGRGTVTGPSNLSANGVPSDHQHFNGHVAYQWWKWLAVRQARFLDSWDLYR